MARGRRPKITDDRMDWRDPDMPVLLMNARTGRMEELSPGIVNKIAWFRMRKLNKPCWRDDPTYYARRKK